ncbi:MAG: anti-sigma factor family protein [Suilimivivens sp.]
MTCKEVEKLIPLFLEDDLDTEDLHEFMEHIEKCDECKEELSIQFLVSEGMARLETGNVFDLQNELKTQMVNAEHALKTRENMKWLLFMLEGFVVVLVITLIALLIFL